VNLLAKTFKQLKQRIIKEDCAIKAKPITERDPQANAIVERVHQVIGNIIRTFELESNYLDEEDPWKGILSATAFAVQSTFHTTLRSIAVCGILGSGEQTRIESCIIKDSRFHGSVTE
jgi:hypothetical protein